MSDQTTNPGLLAEDDPGYDLDPADDREPCGENMCHCDCGQNHVCACDCWRCGECGQHADHCQCDDEEL